MNKVKARARLLNQSVYIAPFVPLYTHDLLGDPKQHIFFRIKRSANLSDNIFSTARDVLGSPCGYNPKSAYG